jgi:hypothetical protein
MKLADFGLARNHGSPVAMTSEVVTRWDMIHFLSLIYDAHVRQYESNHLLSITIPN